jgi:hypothetical protein
MFLSCIHQANYVVDLYLALRERYGDCINQCSIGVIVFYRAQRRLISKLFKDRIGKNSGVEISTVRSCCNLHAQCTCVCHLLQICVLIDRWMVFKEERRTSSSFHA